MTRGLVVPLTPAQVVTRAKYLAGRAKLSDLDDHVRNDGGKPEACATGYYLLKDHNGGKDPSAADPFDRWSKPGSKFTNITADCIGGASWCGGWDRYQPVRFAHLYSGWINTDSMILDCQGERRCFVPLDRPEPGCYVVCASGAPGHKVGHIAIVIEVPLEWDPTVKDCWKRVIAVDVAARMGRANMATTALGWFGTGAVFARSIMS